MMDKIVGRFHVFIEDVLGIEILYSHEIFKWEGKIKIRAEDIADLEYVLKCLKKYLEEE